MSQHGTGTWLAPYEAWAACDTWPLEDAVALIDGDPPPLPGQARLDENPPRTLLAIAHSCLDIRLPFATDPVAIHRFFRASARTRGHAP